MFWQNIFISLLISFIIISTGTKVEKIHELHFERQRRRRSTPVCLVFQGNVLIPWLSPVNKSDFS